MKKILTLISAAVIVSACSSTPEQVANCTFPDAPEKAAPMWICTESLDGVDVAAVGAADKSKAGPQFTKQMAVAAARVQLASNFKTHVQNQIKQYAETTGSGDAETVDRVNSSTSNLITDQSLPGTKPMIQATSPNGTLYVLVGMDSNTAKAATMDAVNTSMNNDQAAWQQFRAQKSQDELAAAIAAQRGGQ